MLNELKPLCHRLETNAIVFSHIRAWMISHCNHVRSWSVAQQESTTTLAEWLGILCISAVRLQSHDRRSTFFDLLLQVHNIDMQSPSFIMPKTPRTKQSMGAASPIDWHHHVDKGGEPEHATDQHHHITKNNLQNDSIDAINSQNRTIDKPWLLSPRLALFGLDYRARRSQPPTQLPIAGQLGRPQHQQAAQHAQPIHMHLNLQALC